MVRPAISKSARIQIAKSLLYLSALGVLILTAPIDGQAFNTAVIDWATNELCGHITGNFGAMLTSVAVLGAVVSAALGAYRAFFGAIIVAIGCFATPDIVKLYFSDVNCGGTAGLGNMGETDLPGAPAGTAFARQSDAVGTEAPKDATNWRELIDED